MVPNVLRIHIRSENKVWHATTVSSAYGKFINAANCRKSGIEIWARKCQKIPEDENQKMAEDIHHKLHRSQNTK